MKKILILLFTLISFSAFSQDDIIIPERPGYCYGSMIIPTPYFQTDYGLGHTGNEFTNYVQFRKAINKRFEVKMGGLFIGKEFIGVGAGTKFSIIEENKTRPAVSGLFMVDLYNDVIVGASYAPSLRLIGQKNLWDNWIFVGNVGAGYFSRDNTMKYIYGLNVAYLAGKFTPDIECYREIDENFYGYTGISYLIINSLSVDGGVYYNLSNQCDFSRAEIGVSWRFKTR